MSSFLFHKENRCTRGIARLWDSPAVTLLLLEKEGFGLVSCSQYYLSKPLPIPHDQYLSSAPNRLEPFSEQCNRNSVAWVPTPLDPVSTAVFRENQRCGPRPQEVTVSLSHSLVDLRIWPPRSVGRYCTSCLVASLSGQPIS